MTITFPFHAYGRFGPQRRVGPARWDWFDLLWIHQGRVTISFMDEAPIRCTTGQGVVIYPDTRFEGDAVNGWAHASVMHFDLRSRRGLLEPMRRLYGQRRGFMHVRHDDLDDDIARLHTLADERSSPLARDMATAQLALVLGQLEPVGPADPLTSQARAFHELLDYLKTHLDEPISLDEMARRVHLSPSHFRARFRDRMGDSPARYLQSLRMREAARMMRTSTEPIKRIARSVGYRELANFYRAFRAAHSLTPAAYRAHHALRG